MEESRNVFNVTVTGGTNINVVEHYHAGQQATNRFPMCMDDRKLNLLYQFLVNKGMIAGSTLSNNFVYMMGGTETPTRIGPVEWLVNVQELREVVSFAFGDLIRREALKMSDLERITPYCFCKDGRPLSLAKNDSRKSSGIIADFFEKIATM